MKMMLKTRCLLLTIACFSLAAASDRYNFMAPARCPEGSRPDDIGGCMDDDECRKNPLLLCGSYAGCLNTAGSFTCVCQAGYGMNYYGKCVDVDECKEGKALCSVNENCVNELGKYACYCKAGFVRDPNVGCKKIGVHTPIRHPGIPYPPPPHNGYPYPPPPPGYPYPPIDTHNENVAAAADDHAPAKKSS